MGRNRSFTYITGTIKGVFYSSVQKISSGVKIIWDPVNNKTTMVAGTIENVEKETYECLQKGAPVGGYILSTDHSLHDDIPLENVKALL